MDPWESHEFQQGQVEIRATHCINADPGGEGMESKPAEKYLVPLVDLKVNHEAAMSSCRPERQPYPGLHQKKCDQKD